MSLNSYALTTTARLSSFSDLADADTTLLDSMINAVTDYIENYCGRRFKLTTYTKEEYDGTGAEVLLLDNYPIVTFTQLQVRSSLNNENTWESIDANQYFVYKPEGYLKFIKGRIFLSEHKFYRCTYTAGYDFDTSSKTLESVGLGDLEYAVWKMATQAYNQRKGDSNIQSERLGDYSVTFRKMTMEDESLMGILDKYARQEWV